MNKTGCIFFHISGTLNKTSGFLDITDGWNVEFFE